jgi:SAM-dependent methyltransferase
MTLTEKFDIVYTSQGVLCWLNDLNRWATVISHFLRPNGRFYIMEEHPFAVTLDEQEFRHRPDYPYFHDAEPDHQDGETYQWSWAIGDIVNSLVAAGLRVQFLNEYDYTFYQRVPYMTSKDGRWWSIPGYRLPLMFSLIATKG